MQCVFCNHHTENTAHLFLECRVVRDIIQRINDNLSKHSMSINGLNNDEKTILNLLRSKLGMNQMSRLAIAWWSVWYFRNQIIFNNNTTWNTTNIVEFIKKQFLSWSQAKQEEKMDGINTQKTNNKRTSARKKKGIHWEKPEVGQYKINFDGSLNSNGKASTGFVIRDYQGEIVSMKGESIEKATVVGAEAAAVCKGISEALRLNIKDVIIEGDNLCVINAIKGTWKCPWEEDMIIADSRIDLRSFRTVCIRHVFREINCVADRVAFLGHTTTTSNPDSDLELQVLIRKDALGWTTDRL